MVQSNGDKPNDAMKARIEALLKDGPMTVGRIHNRCQKWPQSDVTAVLDHMVQLGMLNKEDHPASRGGGRTTIKYALRTA
jgi:predicted transcriptional regulator